MAAAQQTGEAPWHEAFGEPKANVSSVPAETVLADLEGQPLGAANAHRRFLLVDVRRTDWEGGTIASSINLPAHTLYQTRPMVYQLCKQAGVELIIFYCGSCGGRGPRAAGWMQDYLDDVGEKKIQSVYLEGV
ncbi:unnamed protein product [Parascedosporium putredinis]|uniref:Rhodanese domain-containing protein n=1 Tax=Parascedosporium putredinis TaxID=1442378 RepID=A0A9P1H9G4_9PEZI|nr:unnamed protein product [Parascedosporium putredinis]CAI8001872.1 unnamed protein product [Parascedosporium putredinis]